MKLYRYQQDYGRMGALDGVFIADENDVKWFMGAEVWVDDVLGKHSEVTVAFNLNTIKPLEVSEQTVREIHTALGKSISGMTPYEVDYLIEEWRSEHLLEPLEDSE